jgi:crotonobetaine/carnitine-CoA ligase
MRRMSALVPSPLTPASTLGDALRQAAREAPTRPLLRMAQGEWSVAELDRQSDRLARGLRDLGVAPGHTVSVMLPNVPEFVVAWFALAKLGAVMAPVNTAFTGQALVNAIELVQSRVLIAHDSLAAQWRAARPALTQLRQVLVIGAAAAVAGEQRFEQVPRDARADDAPWPEVRPSDLCLLLYTSGTTGRSKAVMLAHRFVMSQGAAFAEQLGLRADDVLYCPYPLFHLDASVLTVAPALVLGAVAAIGARFSVSRYWDEMRAFRATVFDFMGATLTMLYKQPASPRDRDHQARLGWGVPMPAWADDFEQRFGCRLVEIYGSTEVGLIMAPPQGEPRRPGSCGRIGPLWQAELHDAEGFAVPAGQPGELVVRPLAPDALLRGYWAMPEATLAALRDQWFHTGDVMRQDADGHFYFVGRTKDMVRRRGENISAAEVEQGLESHPAVREAAVFGVPSELTEEEVMACVVRQPGATLDAAALAAHARGTMARFMVPRYIRFMDELPRTPTDKVEKFRLAAQGITADTVDTESPTKDPSP